MAEAIVALIEDEELDRAIVRMADRGGAKEKERGVSLRNPREGAKWDREEGPTPHAACRVLEALPPFLSLSRPFARFADCPVT
jgi:hypothetical protein